jgi:hypothetical protein
VGAPAAPDNVPTAIPLHFEINRGQADPRVKFLSRGASSSLFLTPAEAVLVLAPAGDGAGSGELGTDPKRGRTRTVLRLRMLGANPEPVIRGADELPGRSNYLIGNDPARWRTDIPNFARAVYEGVYPGIDLVFYGNPRELEYDFVLAPGSDPTSIRLAWDGAERLALDEAGNLLIDAGGNRVVQQAPRIWQEGRGGRERVAGGYLLSGADQVSFQVASYDRSRPLVIDPVLLYSTYLGGAGNDGGADVAVDGLGNAYVTGYTESADFPTSGAFQATAQGNRDAFVSKLSPSGNALLYSTYLGGSDDETGWGIDVDASGSAYVTGTTESSNFPTVGPIQATFQGIEDVFVTKLNAAGNGLVYSTYLGGDGPDWGNAIAVDAAGYAYITGYTRGGFPMANAYQGVREGPSDAFVSKLAVNGGSLVYSTYLGGGVDSDYFEMGNGIAADGSGHAHVTGHTAESDFDTTAGSYQTTCTPSEAFVTKLAPSGSSLVYSTCLGGSGAGGERGTGIALDDEGNAYVTGVTDSTDFPTQNAFEPNYQGGSDDAFVTKLNASGNGLVYSTYLGGADEDLGYAIAVDASDCAYVTGETHSSDFPKANPIPYLQIYGGAGDAFASKLDSAGSALVYSNYLNSFVSQVPESGHGIDTGPNSSVWVSGAAGPNFFTVSAFQASNAGGDDAFVVRIRESPLTPVPAISRPGAVVFGALLFGAMAIATALRRRRTSAGAA